MEHLPALMRYRDAPVAEPSNIPIYLLSREARRTVKMVLTGEGSDELLAAIPSTSRAIRCTYQHCRGGAPRPDRAGGSLPYGFRRAKTAIADSRRANRAGAPAALVRRTDRCRLRGSQRCRRRRPRCGALPVGGTG